jgi:hypothetical protein
MTRRNVLAITATVVAVFTALLIANTHRANVLRIADTVDLRVTELRASSQLFVSGGMTHSGLAVTRVSVQRCGSRLVVRVYIAPIRDSSRIGTYRRSIIVSPGVEELWFGDTPRYHTLATVFGLPLRLPGFSDEAGRGALIWKRRGVVQPTWR